MTSHDQHILYKKNHRYFQIDYLIAFCWGFAEATFFFFLPDIYLTRISLYNIHKAFFACFIAAIAACLGGSLMYWFAHFHESQSFIFLTSVPAIFPKLILHVDNTVQTKPYLSLFIAPLKGIPYKIYAVAFGTYHINFFKFIVISFLARAFRFILITGFSAAVYKILKKHFDQNKITCIHLAVWTTVYLIYFSTEIYFNYN